MIINGHQLLSAAPIKGMLKTKCYYLGFSHGLSECGYDIRIAESLWLHPFRRFALSWAAEEFQMPNDLMGRVLNKSTWARLGLDASMTTNIEPGWRGHLTLELRYAGWKPLHIPAGVGIAQVIFEKIAEPRQYFGKYQNQPARSVKAITRLPELVE